MKKHDIHAKNPGFSTRCIHAGTHSDTATGGACSPIFTSTAYTFPNASNRNIYPRYFNVPNQEVINRKVAALEGGESAAVFGSGMAAISTLLLSLLGPGDHAVFQRDLYGGTHHFLTGQLRRLGVEISWAADIGDLASAVRSGTKLIYVESPSNPLLRCLDLEAVAAIGRDNGVLTIIDNTFATPINQTPLALGLNIVVHSATKYLNGHSDLNAGVIVSSATVIRQVLDTAVSFGGMLDSGACHQLERGMKTLALRMERHNRNGMALAEFLAAHPAVAQVHYPGLSMHPDHVVAARQMRGFGGMVSFELRNPGEVEGLLGRFRLALPALSLGGGETLVCVPAQTSHRDLSPADRAAIGIPDGLIRVSAGIEDTEDLLEDFRQALLK